MYKRGLGTTISVILLMFLAIGIIAIVWALLMPLIKESKIPIDVYTTNLELVKVNVSGEQALLTIRRPAGAGDISGFKIVLSNSTDSYVYIENGTIGELETKTLTVDYKYKISNLTTIEVAAVISTEDKEYTTPILSSGEKTEEGIWKTQPGKVSRGGGGGGTTTTPPVTTPVTPACGDASCNGNENCLSCEKDCGNCCKSINLTVLNLTNNSLTISRATGIGEMSKIVVRTTNSTNYTEEEFKTSISAENKLAYSLTNYSKNYTNLKVYFYVNLTNGSEMRCGEYVEHNVSAVVVECKVNSDCGNITSGLICLGNNLTNITITPTCINNSCQNISFSALIEACKYSCKNVSCLPKPPECILNADCGANFCNIWQVNYCKGNEVWHNRTCANFSCMNSSCLSTNYLDNIKIESCGVETLIGNYCIGNNIYANYSVSSCIAGKCSLEYEQRLNESCEYGCKNSSCLAPQCYSDIDCTTDYYSTNYCNNSKVYSEFHNVSCIKGNCTETISSVLRQNCGTDYCSIFGSNYCKEGNVFNNKTCMNFTCSDGKCSNITSVIETKAEDCGQEAKINNLCYNGNIYANYSVPSCSAGKCSVKYESRINQTCSYGCENSACVVPECTSADADCKPDYLSAEYCLNNNVYAYLHDFSCVNFKCVGNIISQLKDDCGVDYCDSWNKNYCKDGDLKSNRTCYNTGCLAGSCFRTAYSEERTTEDCPDIYGCTNDRCGIDEICNDGIDNDFNGQCDYDSSYCSHGDPACKVEVKSITVSNLNPVENTQIIVDCESSVGNINSISANVGGSECLFVNWTGNIARFNCNAGNYGTKIAYCTVDSSKSYQLGGDKIQTINVLASSCSSYGQESVCEADARCDYCAVCSGLKSFTGAGNCVDAGKCSYACQLGACNAECDLTNGGWTNYLCDNYCSGNNLYTRDDVFNTCNPDCTSTKNTCSVGISVSCGVKSCDASKHLVANKTGSCNNPCIDAGTATDGTDSYCGNCTLTFPDDCACENGWINLDGNLENGCECKPGDNFCIDDKSCKEGESCINAGSCNAYCTAVTAEEGLISYYSFDGNVNDSAGNNHGVLYGAVYAPGKIGQGLSFDGVNDYVDLGNVLNPGLGNFSVALWFREDSSASSHMLYNKENLYETGVNSGYAQYAWQPSWTWYGGTTFQVIPGSWYYIVVVYDLSNQYLYKNGKLVYSRAQTGNIGNNTAKLLIGARGDTAPSAFFKGIIDDVKFYNRTLNASEINKTYISMTRCTDLDSDSYGDINGYYGTIEGCIYEQADCNDTNNKINPGAVEACYDGIDNDCDGLIDSLDTANCYASSSMSLATLRYNYSISQQINLTDPPENTGEEIETGGVVDKRFSLTSEQEKYFAIPEGTAVEKIEINKEFKFSAKYPLTADSITALSLTGNVYLEEEGFVRVIAKDDNDKEYLIFDSVLLPFEEKVDIENYCEETCDMRLTSIKEIAIEMDKATIYINSVDIKKGGFFDRFKISQFKDKSKQEEIKVKKINARNKEEGINWVAGETPLSQLSYEEKRNLFSTETGEKLEEVPNTQGLEYYAGGSFEPTGVILDTSKLDYESPKEPGGGPMFFHPFVSGGVPGPSGGDVGGGGPSGGSGIVVLQGVPAYGWWRGCGPTSDGMVLGYWDNLGLPNLINTTWQDMVASWQHYEEYSLDKGSPYDCSDTMGACNNVCASCAYCINGTCPRHPDNCIADFAHTSQSYYGQPYGWTAFSYIDDGMRNYANYVGYPNKKVTNMAWYSANITLFWGNITSEIDKGRPVVFLVDSDGNGQTDHFITVIGYDQTDLANKKYAAYNTWDSAIHWYNFKNIGGGAWSVFGATFFDPGFNLTQTCGNNVRELFEECDGNDSTSCSKRCSEICTCLPQSKITNTGTLNIQGYLLMKIQKNNVGTWQDYQTVVNETTLRTINAGQTLKLDSIWNINNARINETGEYRVYVSLNNATGMPIQTKTGYINSTWNFNVG